MVLNKPAASYAPQRYGRGAKANRIWLVAQVVFAIMAHRLGDLWRREKLEAVWRRRAEISAVRDLGRGLDVDQRRAHPPLLTDSARFSHAVFQAPTGMTFQKMDQSFVRYGATIDTLKHTISLKKPADSTWKATLAYQRPTPTKLSLEGDMDGKHIQMAMTPPRSAEIPPHQPRVQLGARAAVQPMT